MSYFLFFTDGNGNDGTSESNDWPESKLNVKLELTSDKKTYSTGETIILYYYIKNNESVNLSSEKYVIRITLVIGPNKALVLHDFTKPLLPGEEFNGSLEINRDLDPGEHTFKMSFSEFIKENRYFQHQEDELVIEIR